MTVRVGVDLGGTKILAALLDGDEVITTAKASTPRTEPAAVIAAIVALVDRVDPDGRADAVGLGLPGLIDAEAGTVRSSPNVVGFDQLTPVRDQLTRAVRRRVAIGNDVNVATLAEHRVGAGQGTSDMLGVFVGTGVGGGLIIDGRLRSGRHGLAAEIGHMPVDLGDGPVCGCGRLGHLEAYAGRASLERQARVAHQAGRTTLLVELAGAKRMKSGVWEKALAAGDTVAGELIETATRAMITALISVLVTVDIELIVLGGGLAERLGESYRIELEQGIAAGSFADIGVPVRWVRLGDESGAIGAAYLVA